MNRLPGTRLLGTVATVALVALVVVAPAVAAGGTPDGAYLDSLPAVTSGARPGPDVLYAPRPVAPQLENRRPEFRAGPILIAGAERYVDGEYLYQDYLNDDNGADVDGDGDGAQSGRVGDLRYPTDRERYGDNAADLVEYRVALADDGLLVRFTLNTMRAPDAAIVALVLDADADDATGGDVAGLPDEPFPGADVVIRTWGTGAELTRADGSAVALAVETDTEAAQLTVAVPAGLLPVEGVVEHVVIAGVHDGLEGWAVPLENADETSPGGTDGADVSGIFNLGPRLDEPVTQRGTPSDEAQAFALGAREAASFFHPLDLDALRAREDRDLAPTAGTMIRIFPSRLDLGGGRATTFPHVRQQLAEYSVRVPEGASDGRTVGLTLYLHALNEWHWTNNANPYLEWVGDERDALVATPLNRGPNGFYLGPAEYDTFEVWNDLAHHYRIDPTYVSIMGTSMGGYGAYRHASQYPDLFARAVTNVGPPVAGIWAPPMPSSPVESLTNLWLENTYNVPFLNQAAIADELVPVAGTRAQNLGAPELGIRGFDQLGHRFRYRLYDPAEHLVMSISSDRAVPAFLGDHRVDRDPVRVRFRYVPAADDVDLGLVHDHAYWVSDVRLGDHASPAPAQFTDSAPLSAYVDAYSRARGVGLPTSSPTADAGVADTVPAPLTYKEVGRTWTEPPAVEPENVLDLTLEGVGSVTLDAARAGLDTDEVLTLEVVTDGPARIALTGDLGGARVAGAEVVARGKGQLVVAAEADTTIIITPAGAAAPVARPTTPAGPLPATGAAPAAGAAGLLAVLLGARRRSRGGLA